MFDSSSSRCEGARIVPQSHQQDLFDGNIEIRRKKRCWEHAIIIQWFIIYYYYLLHSW